MVAVNRCQWYKNINDLGTFDEDEWETGRIRFRESSRQLVKSWSAVAIIRAAEVSLRADQSIYTG